MKLQKYRITFKVPFDLGMFPTYPSNSFGDSIPPISMVPCATCKNVKWTPASTQLHTFSFRIRIMKMGWK